MIFPKKELFDRVWQSFEFFFKFLKGILLPVFLYYFLFWTLFSFINTSFSVWYLWDDFFKQLSVSIAWIEEGNSLDLFTSIISNSKIVFLGYFSMVVWLFTALILIPIKLWLIRWIKQWFNAESINILDNFKFWIENFLNSFKTYWYIFAYVYLYPALAFIALSLVLLVFMQNKDLMDTYSGILMTIAIVSAVFSIWFIIVRWIKATFALFSAVDNDSFTEEDFKNSIKPTHNNLWRIFWNILLFWLIVSFASSIVWGIFNTIVWLFWSTSIFESLLSWIDYKDMLKPWVILD